MSISVQVGTNGQKYTQKGSNATLTILVKMAAGNLVITD
jgi:hypothetical protein